MQERCGDPGHRAHRRVQGIVFGPARGERFRLQRLVAAAVGLPTLVQGIAFGHDLPAAQQRSEEHTSELQSPCNLVCRLLLEKKKSKKLPLTSYKLYTVQYICRLP